MADKSGVLVVRMMLVIKDGRYYTTKFYIKPPKQLVEYFQSFSELIVITYVDHSIPSFILHFS